MKKTGRNDPCPCGSGKKFKKCCEGSLLGKKYMARQISPNSDLLGKSSGLTSLFQNNISTAKPEDSTRKISPSAPPEKDAPSPSLEKKEREKKDDLEGKD